MTITWEGAGVIIAVATLILAVVDHKISTVKAMTTISVKLDNVVKSVDKMDAELEKRDTQIKALWSKSDNLNGRLIVIETSLKNREVL